MSVHRIDVTAAEAGARLDALLATHCACSRARARALIDAGAVRVDGRRVDPRAKGSKPSPGSVIELDEEPAALDRLRPAPDLPLPVLASGEGWVVVDKPAGVPVHPLRATETGTVLQRLVARCPQVDGIGEGGLRSGVVHRLDVDTSGCQVFATDEARFEELRRAFREHTVDKVYRALVFGRPDAHGETTLDLHVARHRPAKVRADRAGEGPAGARRCATRWRRLETFHVEGRDVSLVEARPHSGFLHQIRVTLAHHGHPLLGDAVYGDGTGAPRQMLHASALRVGAIDAHAPDPADMQRCLDDLRARADR